MEPKKVPSPLIKKREKHDRIQERNRSKVQKWHTYGQSHQDVREVHINDQFHPGEEKKSRKLMLIKG